MAFALKRAVGRDQGFAERFAGTVGAQTGRAVDPAELRRRARGEAGSPTGENLGAAGRDEEERRRRATAQTGSSSILIGTSKRRAILGG